MTRSLEGCRVLVTRERPGQLATMLAERGAIVVHMPLIGVVEPVDDGAALRDVLARLHEFDWLIVTSAAGAERVGAAARGCPSVRLAAVGTATATVLEREAGRSIDLVPTIQRAAALAEEFIRPGLGRQRVLIAQADRAAPTLADALTRAGHAITTVVAYRTVDREPDPIAVAAADAVVFASGSAVESWCRVVGPSGPPIVVAIGPSTSAVAEQFGLKVTGLAADHSLDGLVTELERQLADVGRTTR